MDESKKIPFAQRLAKRATEKGIRRHINDAAFRVLRADIAEGFESGFTQHFIWETLREESRIDFTYPVFRRLVKKYFPPGATKIDPSPLPTPQETTLTPKKIAPDVPRVGFEFNPSPDEKRLFKLAESED